VAVFIAGNVSMSAEKNVEGSLGKGPVDWVMMFKKFMVCLVEAKRDDLDKGMAQNIAQIVASREVFIASKYGKKRSREEISVLDNIASSGLVTCGDKWIFTRYVRVNGVGKFIRSSPFQLVLEKNPNKSSMILAMSCILKKIIGMICFQKNQVENIEEEISKKARSSSSASISSSP
jgi:hypothetical protein